MLLDLMGIAIALVYLPLLMALAAFAAFAGSRLAVRKDEWPLQHWRSRSFMAAGAVITTAATLITASEIPRLDSHGFTRLFWQIGITLLLPLALGFALLLISWVSWLITRDRTIYLSSNRIGVGSLQAVSLVPLALAVFHSVCLNQHGALYNPMLCR